MESREVYIMSANRKSKPIIFAIDDEVSVLNAVERDLRQRYGKEYRIMKASKGSTAVENLKQLKTRNSVIALFVADQRMPEMEGTEFLEKAIKLFPDAKKVLLTAYADTQ